MAHKKLADLTAKQRAALDEQLTAWLGMWLTASRTHTCRLAVRADLAAYCKKAKIEHRGVWEEIAKPALIDLAAHLGVEGWYTDTFGFYHHG